MNSAAQKLISVSRIRLFLTENFMLDIIEE